MAKNSIKFTDLGNQIGLRNALTLDTKWRNIYNMMVLGIGGFSVQNSTITIY